jgi:hypothetical protein
MPFGARSDWCGALDDTAYVSRIQPAGDLRAAIFAALARGKSARRWVHGRLGVVGVDHSRALRQITLHQRMQLEIARNFGCASTQLGVVANPGISGIM